MSIINKQPVVIRGILRHRHQPVNNTGSRLEFWQKKRRFSVGSPYKGKMQSLDIQKKGQIEERMGILVQQQLQSEARQLRSIFVKPQSRRVNIFKSNLSSQTDSKQFFQSLQKTDLQAHLGQLNYFTNLSDLRARRFRQLKSRLGCAFPQPPSFSGKRRPQGKVVLSREEIQNDYMRNYHKLMRRDLEAFQGQKKFTSELNWKI